MAVGAIGKLDLEVALKDYFSKPSQKITESMDRMYQKSFMVTNTMKDIETATERFKTKGYGQAVLMGILTTEMGILGESVRSYTSATLAANMSMARGVRDTAMLFIEQGRLRLMYGATTEEVAALTAATSLLKLSGSSMREFNRVTLMLGATTDLGIQGATNLSEFLVRDLGVSVDNLFPAFDQLSKTVRSVGISGSEAATALKGASNALARMSEDARGKALPAFIRIAGAFKTLGVDTDFATGMINDMMDVTSSGGVLLASKIGRAMGKTGEEMRRGLADGTISADVAMQKFVETMQVGTKTAPMNALQIKIQAGIYHLNEQQLTKLVRAKEKGRTATMWENKATMGLVATYRLLANPLKRYGTMAKEAVVWVGGIAGALANMLILTKAENLTRLNSIRLKTIEAVADTYHNAKMAISISLTAEETAAMAANGIIQKSNFLWDMKLFAIGMKKIVMSRMNLALTWLGVGANSAEATALGVTTVAQWNLNAAMDANPVGAIIVAIVALVALFAILYKKFGLATAAVVTLTVVSGPVIGAIAALVAIFAWLWKKLEVGTIIMNELTEILQPVKDAFNEIKAALQPLWDSFSKIFNTGKGTTGMFAMMAKGVGFLVKGIFWPLKKILSLVAIGFKVMAVGIMYALKPVLWAIDKMLKVKAFFGGLFGGGPTKAMAEGGIVTKPTTALIGEAGPEAVIPLGRRSFIPIVSGSDNIVKTIRELIEITKKTKSRDSGGVGMDLGMDYPIYRLIGSYGV